MRLRQLLLFFLCILSIKIYAQSTASQQVDTFTIEAPQMKTQKKIWIYLPKEYQNSEKSYSVMYMHDAQNLFDVSTSYVGEWKIDEYLDSISDNKTIVVGIEHGNEKRIEELTPYPHETYGGGKGDLYLEFIIKTLKPHIDSDYRTIPDVKHTSIAGSSLGGLISLYAIIKYPETFGSAGIFSPAFWINPELYDFVATATIPQNAKFYLLVGSEEGESMVPDQAKMVSLLKSKGIKNDQIVNKIINGGKHNENFWSIHFPEAYLWLTKDL